MPGKPTEVIFTINTAAAKEALKRLFYWHKPRRGSLLHVTVKEGTVVLATADKTAFAQPVPAITKGCGEVILPVLFLKVMCLARKEKCR